MMIRTRSQSYRLVAVEDLEALLGDVGPVAKDLFLGNIVDDETEALVGPELHLTLVRHCARSRWKLLNAKASQLERIRSGNLRLTVCRSVGLSSSLPRA